MIEKISGKEVDRLHEKLKINNISYEAILNLLKISSISEMDKLQYNILLIFLERMVCNV